MRLLVAVALALVAVVLLPASQALGRQSAPSAFNATPREGELWLYDEYWTLADVECIGVGARSFRGGSSSSHVLRAILAL